MSGEGGRPDIIPHEPVNRGKPLPSQVSMEYVLCAGHFTEPLPCVVSLTLPTAWELEHTFLPGLTQRLSDPENPALSSEPRTCRGAAFGVEGR